MGNNGKKKDLAERILLIAVLLSAVFLMAVVSRQDSGYDFARNQQMLGKLERDLSSDPMPQGESFAPDMSVASGPQFRVDGIYLHSERGYFRYGVVATVLSGILVLCMLMTAVVSIMVGFYLKKADLYDPRFFCVSRFLLLCALWCATDSTLAQVLGGFSASVCYLSFYAFMTMAMPMISFVRHTLTSRKYPAMDWILWLFGLNVVAQTFLEYFGILSFTRMLPAVHIILVSGVAVSGACLLEEYRKSFRRDLLMIFQAFGALGAGGVLAIVLYWMYSITYYEIIYEIGILVFVLVILTGLLQAAVGNLHSRAEADAYRQLAVEDRLTGLKNRRAFEEELSALEHQMYRYRNVALIFLDLNGLKRINDTFGHSAGDELLIAAARCIEKAFHKNGICYRVGGDEFCVIMKNPDAGRESWGAALENVVAGHNREARHPLSIAWGFSLLRDPQGKWKTISDWKYEADQNMYVDKLKKAGK